LAGAIFPTVIALNCFPPRPLLRTNGLFPKLIKGSTKSGDFKFVLKSKNMIHIFLLRLVIIHMFSE